MMDLPPMPGYASLLQGAILVTVLWNTARAAYNVWFHPLRQFPGPIWNRASKLPYAISIFRGSLAQDMRRLHQQYGDVVRTGPNELAFTDPEAWKNIYQRPVGSEFDELPKNVVFDQLGLKIPHAMITAGKEEHRVLRKALTPSFSEKALRAQEQYITGHIDLLISQLRKYSTNSKGLEQPVDMVSWYNWTTFDIIGELVYTESFGCLETASWHPWVKFLLQSTKQMTFLTNLTYLGFGTLSILAMIPIIGNQRTHLELTQAKLKKRLELGTPRNDLIEGLLERGKNANLDMPRLEINSTVLCIAGSETTATQLCGVTYLLLTNRDALKRCSDEVRSTFQDESQITISSVKNLPYMLACLEEAMRCYPPVPNALHRMVPSGGCTIAGHYVPEGTDVTIYQYAQNYSEKYWVDPYAFQPQRFLKDEKSSGDRTEALQPFHVGPRDCIGRTLAFAEMRLVLARLLFNFDMTMVDENPHWIDRQKVFTFWIKPSLNVYLKSRI